MGVVRARIVEDYDLGPTMQLGPAANEPQSDFAELTLTVV
jgi:hypothetical protein